MLKLSQISYNIVIKIVKLFRRMKMKTQIFSILELKHVENRVIEKFAIFSFVYFSGSRFRVHQ